MLTPNTAFSAPVIMIWVKAVILIIHAKKKESSGPMKWDDIPTAEQDYEDSVIDQFPEADFDDPDTFDDDIG